MPRNYSEHNVNVIIKALKESELPLTKEEIDEKVGRLLKDVKSSKMSITKTLRKKVEDGVVKTNETDNIIRYYIPREVKKTAEKPKPVQTHVLEQTKTRSWDGAQKIKWPLSTIDKSLPAMNLVSVTKTPLVRNSDSENGDLLYVILVKDKELNAGTPPRNYEVLPLKEVEILYGEQCPDTESFDYIKKRDINFIVIVYRNETAEVIQLHDQWVFVKRR